MKLKIFIGVLVATVVVEVTILLLMRGTQVSGESPVTVVKAVHKHCADGNYGETARFFEGKPAKDEAVRKSFCIRIIEPVELYSTATTSEDHERAVVKIGSLSIAGPGSHYTWTLIRRNERWLVAEVTYDGHRLIDSEMRGGAR